MIAARHNNIVCSRRLSRRFSHLLIIVASLVVGLTHATLAYPDPPAVLPAPVPAPPVSPGRHGISDLGTSCVLVPLSPATLPSPEPEPDHSATSLSTCTLDFINVTH